MNCITPEKEIELQEKLFPNFTKTLKEVAGEKYKTFNDIEDIKMINNPNEYGVIVNCGLNFYEGLQNRQDSCIKMNVLYGANFWVTLKKF